MKPINSASHFDYLNSTIRVLNELAIARNWMIRFAHPSVAFLGVQRASAFVPPARIRRAKSPNYSSSSTQAGSTGLPHPPPSSSMQGRFHGLVAPIPVIHRAGRPRACRVRTHHPPRRPVPRTCRPNTRHPPSRPAPRACRIRTHHPPRMPAPRACRIRPRHPPRRRGIQCYAAHKATCLT